MKITQLNDIPPWLTTEFKELLTNDFENVKADILSGATELYKVNETYVGLRADGEWLHVVIMLGKDLASIGDFVINVAKQKGFKNLVAWTKRKGMCKYLESVGAEMTNQYFEFTLGV